MAHPPLAEPAGRRASGWASRWSPPRPSDDASSLCPDASPAKPAGSPCIFPRTGPGKISSALPWRDCAPCRSLPDRRPRRLIVRRAAAQICARLVTQCPLLQFALIISPAGPAEGRQHPLGVATTSCAQLDWSGSRPRRLDPDRLNPSPKWSHPFGGLGLSCLYEIRVHLRPPGRSPSGWRCTPPRFWLAWHDSCVCLPCGFRNGITLFLGRHCLLVPQAHHFIASLSNSS